MENFMIPEAMALHDDGWDSIVISSFSDENIKNIPSGLRYYTVPMERTYNIKVAAKCIYQLFKIFRKEKFDIVQYGTTHACIFGSIASFLARVPNRIFLQWGPTGYNDYSGYKRELIKSIEVLIGRLSTTIRTVSHKNLKESVKDGLYPARKASVVGEGGTIGVDINNYQIEKKAEFRDSIRKKYGLGKKDFVFGFTGRISIPKGINELLEAFRNIHEESNVKLMLIGPNESSDVIGLFEWAKSCQDIIFTGSIPHEHMPEYFAALDVLVHPTYREGFGMVLQEAMAMNTPIITTDIPGPSEVIEENMTGLLVPAQDSNALQNAMERLYTDNSFRDTLASNGRERVIKHFERNHRLRLLVEDKRNIINDK